MKLLLASNSGCVHDCIESAFGMPKCDMRIGYITTAAKKSGSNRDYVEEHRQRMHKEGMHFEEYDIEGKTPSDHEAFFADKNIIYVEGGNTFYLLKALRESNFDTSLGKLLQEGKCYVGASAGAYIMCPTIEVADWNTTGRDRCGVTDFTALGYAPFVLKAHYKDEMEPKIRINMQNLTYPLRILRDGQGILVEDDACTFMGEGKEVILA